MNDRNGAGRGTATERLRLADIPLGQEVELDCIELPEADMEALLERGVLPGCRMCPIRKSPFGDPIVRVDGTVLALRRETASCLCVRRLTTAA
jgi:Fe2+ transport system protein FeoA